VEPVAWGAKVFIHPQDGFDSFLNAAFRVKGVPLTVVTDRAVADYEVVGSSDSQKAGWAKIIFLKQTGSSEQASISVVDVRTSEVAFAYSYNNYNTYFGRQTAAESCAKHLGWHIRANKRLASTLTPRTDEEIRALRLKYYAESPAGKESARVAAALAPPAKVISMRVTSTPASAELEVDGEYWGTTPTAELSRLKNGPHVVVVKKTGFARWERTVNLAAGEERVIHAELEPAASDPGRPRIAGLQ
jgi:hypothetical protein